MAGGKTRRRTRLPTLYAMTPKSRRTHLRHVPAERRTARFRCVIAVAEPGGREAVVAGTVEGVILDAPRGTRGFGYDPLFFYPPLGRSFAELSDTEKAAVSHRGHALRAARRLLCECYTAQPVARVWRSLVAHLLWEQGAGGSNPLTPTSASKGAASA